MATSLEKIVADFARAIQIADSRAPIATGIRSNRTFRPGIGPHTEARTIELVLAELKQVDPYFEQATTDVNYPRDSKQKCDLVLGPPGHPDWCLEVKMFRPLGDNGKSNDNNLMHILSPYAKDRSAVTDCSKLLDSHFEGRKAVLIYGYDSADFPMELAIDSFEALAARNVELGTRVSGHFSGLIHPVHSSGTVFAWEVLPP